MNHLLARHAIYSGTHIVLSRIGSWPSNRSRAILTAAGLGQLEGNNEHAHQREPDISRKLVSVLGEGDAEAS